MNFLGIWRISGGSGKLYLGAVGVYCSCSINRFTNSNLLEDNVFKCCACAFCSIQ